MDSKNNTVEHQSIINSYWKKIPIFWWIKKEIYGAIANSFCDYFESQGYTQQESVDINSWIDDTVAFIGASTSVLKPYLLNWTIPSKWVFMQQPAFRTHNLKKLQNDEPIRRWSTFTSICCMSNIEDWKQLLLDTNIFLLDVLKIPLENIAINIKSTDEQLLDLLESVNNPIKLNFDTKDDVYYTHKYWLWNITWKNFNWVMRDERTGNFNDVWNYIIIGSPEKQYWIESWFGNSVIMKEMYSLDHVLDTSVISDIVPGTSISHRKLQDSIISSFLMIGMWIVPRSHNEKWRILKRYLKWIKYNQNLLGISDLELEDILKRYEISEFCSNQHYKTILWYLKDLTLSK